jgi:hypothetical protein
MDPSTQSTAYQSQIPRTGTTLSFQYAKRNPTFPDCFHEMGNPTTKTKSGHHLLIAKCSPPPISMTDTPKEPHVTVFIRLLLFNPEKRGFETQPMIRIDPQDGPIDNDHFVKSTVGKDVHAPIAKKATGKNDVVCESFSFLHPYYRHPTTSTATRNALTNSPMTSPRSNYIPLTSDMVIISPSSCSNDLYESNFLPRPSSDWWQAYREWIQGAFDQPSSPPFGASTGSSCPSMRTKRLPTTGHPKFETSDSLHDFNERGVQLVFWLRKEMTLYTTVRRTNVTFVVEPFQPLFRNVQLAPNAASWWLIKDMSYDYVIPSIQRLPISDELKCQLSQWRRRTSLDWTDSSRRASFRHNGFDLQQILLYELNVRPRQQDNFFIYNANHGNRRHSLFST